MSGAVPGYDSDTYEYDDDYIETILAVLVQDRRFLDSYRRALDHSYFKNRRYRILASLILDYYDEHRSPPDRVVLKAMIKDWSNKLPAGKGLDKQAYFDMINVLYKIDITGVIGHVRSYIVEFGQHQALVGAIQSCMSLLPKGRKSFPQMRDFIDQALRIGVDQDDLGHFFFEEGDAREIWRAQRKANKVPTGIKGMDDALEGGASFGELCIVAGGTSFGKTTSLVNLCRAAVLSNHTSVYYTLEQGDMVIGNKFDCSFFSKTTEELRLDPVGFQTKIEALRKIYRRRLIIKHFPSDAVTPQDLRAHFNTLKSKGIRPSAVFVDYPDHLLPPSTVKGATDDHSKLRAIYSHMFNWALEENVVLWAASDIKADIVKQTRKREEVQPDVMDLGGTYHKAKKADILIIISQTEADREWSETREKRGYRAKVRLAKTRNGVSRLSFDLLFKYAQGLWIPVNKATP